jgi:hypothetical protein
MISRSITILSHSSYPIIGEIGFSHENYRIFDGFFQKKTPLYNHHELPNIQNHPFWVNYNISPT